MKRKWLIILPAVLIAVGGIVAWGQTHKGSGSGPAKAGSSQSSSAPTTTPSQTADPSEGGKYLVIKEWGVRIPLTNLILEATYKIIGNTAYLNTPGIDELIKSEPNCELAKNSQQIVRAQPGDSHHGDDVWTKEQLEKIAIRIGDYYYYQDTLKQVCTPNDEETAVRKEIQDIRGELGVAIGKIDAVN